VALKKNQHNFNGDVGQPCFLCLSYFGVESLALYLCLTQSRIVPDQDRAADAEVRVIDMTPVKRSAENQVKKVNELLRVTCCLYVCLRVQVASVSISVSVSARITAGNERI